MIPYGKKGWTAYLCDTGSIHNGQLGELTDDSIDGTDQCTVEFPDRTIENTFMRLMKDVYIEADNVYFKKGDRVRIISPDSVRNNYAGVMFSDQVVGSSEEVVVVLESGEKYTVRTKYVVKR